MNKVICVLRLQLTIASRNFESDIFCSERESWRCLSIRRKTRLPLVSRLCTLVLPAQDPNSPLASSERYICFASTKLLWATEINSRSISLKFIKSRIFLILFSDQTLFRDKTKLRNLFCISFYKKKFFVDEIVFCKNKSELALAVFEPDEKVFDWFFERLLKINVLLCICGAC